MKSVLGKLKTYVGRVGRDVARKRVQLPSKAACSLQDVLAPNWYDKALQKIAGPRGKAGDNKRDPPLKNGVKKFQA